MKLSKIIAPILFACTTLAIPSFAKEADKKAEPAKKAETTKVEKAPAKETKTEDQVLKFSIETNLGTMKGVLFHKDVPNTVSNFVTLARKGFYNGIIFHRVIPEFMIQTGDPEGTGMGGPGYSFADEFNSKLRHSKAGILSMANAGPNTNGSQFFITVVPTPHLDDRHAVFGELTDKESVDIAIKISKVDAPGTRPKEKIEMKKVTIEGDWFKPVDFKKGSK